MAKFKFLPLLTLLCLISSCGQTNPPIGSESEPDDPISETESTTESESNTESESTNTGKDYGLSLAIPSDRPLKIAQFADIHFGVEGNDWHNDKVDRTKTFMDDLVSTHNPDLIVCSGDNILSTGVQKLKNFINTMEDYKTPWTFIFGNHDSESNAQGYSKRELNDTLLSYDTEYLLYGNEYCEEGASNRYGNFSIQLTNEAKDKLLGSIIFFDAGIHDGSGYQAITTGQIDWYKAKIDALQAEYSTQEANSYQVVPTMVFSHIQLQEHATLYEKAINNNGATFVIPQEGLAVSDIKEGGPKTNTGLYDVMVEKGSTKAYFVGHAHTYRYQVKDNEDGIVLGFGPQTGFSKCFEDNDLARQNYIYNLSSDFTFTTTAVDEDCSNIGLLYSGTYEGKMKLDVESGLYKVQLEFALWNRIVFSYQGKRLAVSDFTEITGYFQNTANATWTDDLYTSTGENFIYSGSKGNVYIFSIDLDNMTLDIDIWVDPNAPVQPVTEVTIKNVNADSGADAASVYTTPGYKFRAFDPYTNKGAYTNNGWRYYIIIDPEGKIAYAVVNPPNGYGGPMGTGYYCHPDYNDWENNPCFTILEGYGPWTPEDASASNKYELHIPNATGWWAITAHGSANGLLAAAFSNGEVKDSSDANLNRRGVYADNLRVVFDEENKLVKATFLE